MSHTVPANAVQLTASEREAIIVASIELNALHGFEDHYSHTLKSLLARASCVEWQHEPNQ